DLVHVFNLDWVCEPYLQIKNAKRQGKKVVLSPIHHSLAEFLKYEQLNRWGLSVLGNAVLTNQPARDTIKNLIKGILYPKKLYPAFYQLFFGIRNEQRRDVAMSDYVLVQTDLEAKDLKLDYKTGDFKWKKVVNGINPEKFGDTLNVKKEKVILSVGRIEPRKNQINLAMAFIRAVNSGELSGYKMIFIGKGNLHHPTYLKEFYRTIHDQELFEYLGFVEQEKLCNLYQTASIFASPSWFETTGLVFLEATVCGVSSLVASGDRAGEYLGDNAVYCDPASVNSIYKALIEAQRPTVAKSFPEFVKKTYTWENCAKQTLEVYQRVLGSSTE
ncbi:MAG: glycosyltransferase, partial [Patescibacteria group bacterium]